MIIGFVDLLEMLKYQQFIGQEDVEILDLLTIQSFSFIFLREKKKRIYVLCWT